jgi:exo-beta-1,3-glucanase (GH17 family)
MRLVCCLLLCMNVVLAAVPVQPRPSPLRRAEEFPFFNYLKGRTPKAALVAYSPTDYDPRPASRRSPAKESLAADLAALRPAFDGLILYGYDADLTPDIVAEAQRQGYRAVVLGIWDVTSATELAGTATLVKQYRQKLALAVCIGNEGLQFGRYTLADLKNAESKLREMLGGSWPAPYCTSEPWGQYQQATVRDFGLFLAPNIHPWFDRQGSEPAAAARWVRGRALALAAKVSKLVLVKETGWPQGGATATTPESQKAFWAAYTQGARLVSTPKRNGRAFFGAAFEAYMLRWKAEASGLPVEEFWGLLTNPARQPSPAFSVWRDLRRPDKRRIAGK